METLSRKDGCPYWFALGINGEFSDIENPSK
jgi:hypothetical protein